MKISELSNFFIVDSYESIALIKGQLYENLNGYTYRCISDGSTPVMQSVSTGWTAECHGVRHYSDGRIDWLSSSGGRFEEI